MRTLFEKFCIHDHKRFNKLCVQFVKFGSVGLLNTGISLAIYYLFIWIDATLYLWGNVVGFLISVANAYFWNQRYVFTNSKLHIWKTLFKSYLAYGGSFLLATAFLYVQVEWLGVSKTIAPVINLVVTIPLNFLVNKFWTFK